MLEPEVTSVLKALRSHGLEVVAIHHHMIGTRPSIMFLSLLGSAACRYACCRFQGRLGRTRQEVRGVSSG